MDIEQMNLRETIIEILVSSGNLSEGVTADLIISAIGAQTSRIKRVTYGHSIAGSD